MKVSSDSIRIGIIPGIDGATRLLEPLARELLPYHTILLNYQRYGRSVEEVRHFLAERVRNERLSVLSGESFGGPVAISMTSGIPTLRALVLVSSFTTPPLEFLSVMTRNDFPGELISAFFRTSIGSWLAASVLLGNQSDLFARFGDQVTKQLTDLPPELLRHRLRAIHSFDILSKIEALPPLLSIEARGDPLRFGSRVYFPRAGGESLAVDGVHLLAETQPSEVARLVREFIAKVWNQSG